MKKIRAHLLAFGASWLAAIVGLICLGLVPNGTKTYHSEPVGEFLRTVGLFGVFSALCVGVAWLVIALPYQMLFLRGRSLKTAGWHALAGGSLGFIAMLLLTQFLPVAEDSWRFTAPIAFVSGSVGVLVLNRALLTRTNQEA